MSRKALIIEDDEGTRMLLRSIAETDGWECRQGESFDDAVNDGAWADVVLLDLSLPGTSGVAMIPRLRMLAPRARIVVVTGHDDAHSRSIEAGADAFVAKPFEIADLLDAMHVDEVIDLRDDVVADDLPWFASAV